MNRQRLQIRDIRPIGAKTWSHLLYRGGRNCVKQLNHSVRLACATFEFATSLGTRGFVSPRSEWVGRKPKFQCESSTMKALFQVSVLLTGMITFILLCVVSFSPDDFWNRHLRSGGKLDSGRIFCVWIFRVWSASLLGSILLYAIYHFLGDKYA